jgi:hypothetical protein
MKKIVLTAFVLVILVMVFSLSAYSQPCPPNDPTCHGNDPSVPFDGGILCIILGAVGLGIKKLMPVVNKA